MTRRPNPPDARTAVTTSGAAIPCLALVIGWLSMTLPAHALTITPAEARAHIGEAVTVEGTVDEVHTARDASATFLDLGGRYPHEPFTGVIFAGDAGAFPNVHALEGRTVDISGRVKLYRGRPEIILHAAGQLKAK